MKFKTDGDEILMEALEKDGNLMSLSKKRPGQKVFSSIVQQSLNDLEYEDGKSARWRPSVARHVVIDPKRNFGSPILEKFGIETSTIFQEYNSFQDIKYLAAIYEIPVSSVREAIEFERSLDKIFDKEKTAEESV